MVPDVPFKQDCRPSLAFDSDMLVHKGNHQLSDGLGFSSFRTLGGWVRAEPYLCEET